MADGTAIAPAAPRPRGRTRGAVAALRMAWPSLGAGSLAAFLLLRMAWQAGGYFPSSYVWAGSVAFGGLGVLLVLHVPRYRLSTHALVGLGALSGLAAWTGLSALWSRSPDAALLDFQRTLLYVALFGLGLLAAGSGRYARYVVWGSLCVILAIVGAGLLSRIYPELVMGTPDVPRITNYRLSYPLSYWNAFGALAAVGAILAFGLAADPRTRVPLRALAAGASVAMAVAMYLSLSRGAWLALMVGVVVLVLIGANRGSLLLTALVVGAASALAIVRLRSYPALVDDPAAGAGQVDAGQSYGPQLILLIAGAVALQAVIAAGRASVTLMDAMRRVVRPVLIALATLACLFAVVAYVLKAGRIEGWSASRLNDGGDWVSRQWNDFLRPTTFSEGGTARLTTAKGTRSDLYRVAFDGFEGHPLWGDGAGSFEYRWTRARRVNEKVVDAHSLEFEMLGELGAVGGLLLIALLASLGIAAVRSRVLPGGLSRSQTSAVGAAVAVWVAHSWVDWDWQMPAFTGVVLVLAASLYPYGRRRRTTRTRPSPWA